MNDLQKLTRYSLWANGSWIDFIEQQRPSDDFLVKRMSQRMLTENLTRVVDYTRFTGEKYRSPISDVLVHLSHHGAHHRGQMATHISAQGITPINTDFIQFCLTNRL